MVRLRLLLVLLMGFGSPLSKGEVTRESAIEAQGPQGPLRGTMLEAAGSHNQVALIIPGSGPIDRDGNSPLGIKAATYRLLAEGLFERGVSSVRIDKRGLFGSAAAIADANAVTIADYVADVEAWTAAILKRSGASCLWILGHSEGGLVAMVAAAGQKDICGLILISTAGRPMGEVLRSQLKDNPANTPLLKQAMSAIDALEAGKTVETSNMASELLPLFRPQVQRFVISEFAYDPAQVLKAYSGPVLILQGQRDLQVHDVDAHLLKQSAANATLVILPNVNHVLKTVSTDSIAANISTYRAVSLPLAPGVLPAITDFISANANPKTSAD